MRTRPGLAAPNVQISFTCFAFDFDKQGRLMLRKDNAVSTVVCLARPQSRGILTLRSADPLAPPVINHQLLGVEDDAVQIAEGLEIARQFMAQPQVKPYVTAEIRPGEGVHGQALVDYVHLASIPLYHPVGTCRMGTDSEAVVDPELRVRGVDGLWVCDNSVMPTLPVGNTNATALMIGDKGSDHVLHALRNTPMLSAAA
ncbi:MAG: GMC oxidoreductase [Caulobacteraceae bacterium]